MGIPSQNDATSGNEDLSVVVDWEKRFKDTQAAYTKAQQKLKEIEAKAKVLEELSKPRVELAKEEAEELEDLKYKDPDAWRAKLDALEREASEKHRAKLNEVTTAATQAAELERRTQILAEFSASHPDIELTDDVIQYDVPKRITNKLEKGEVTFEEFLNDVYTYLTTPKKVGTGNTTLGQPNLGRLGGDSTPTGSAVDRDVVATYSKAVF
jgi:DNA repair exonuclease SbcCD ATPase subunit